MTLDDQMEPVPSDISAEQKSQRLRDRGWKWLPDKWGNYQPWQHPVHDWRHCSLDVAYELQQDEDRRAKRHEQRKTTRSKGRDGEQ